MIKRIFTSKEGITLATLLLAALSLFAQPPVKIEHYSTEQGLSHDIISCMFKDSKGYLWLGTWNGLNRFDGHHITSFNSNANINNGRIDEVVEDQFNHLWIKSYDKQIYRFDKGTEQFTALTKITPLNKKLVIERILDAAHGLLWLKTVDKGLVVLTNLDQERPSYLHFSKSQSTPLRLAADRVNTFFCDSNGDAYVATVRGISMINRTKKGILHSTLLSLGNSTRANFCAVTSKQDLLYFGTTDGKAIVYDKKRRTSKEINLSTSRIHELLLSKHTPKLFATTALGELVTFDTQAKTIQINRYEGGALGSIFEDSSGNLWLEPHRIGVVRFDVRLNTFTTFRQKNDADKIPPRNHFKVFEDKNGLVWAVLRDGGFGYYQTDTKKLAYFYNEPGSLNRKMSNLVVSVLYDHTGVMFLHSDQRGLDKLVFHPNEFKKTLLVNPGMFTSDNNVRGLMSDRKNRIWASARSGRLFIYKDGKAVNVKFDALPNGGIGSVYTIFQSRDGRVWLGTKEKGLFCATPIDHEETRYKLTHFAHHANDPTSISSNQIYSVAEDRLGRIWVGTFDYGLNLVVNTYSRLSMQRFTVNNSGYPAGYNKIRHLAVDDYNRLWIGSTNGLVLAEQSANNQFKFVTYHKVAGNPQSLANNDIQYLFKDHLGQMWVGTSGGGLCLANGNAKSDKISFETFFIDYAMGNNYILSMQEDKNHQLWIATKSSLNRFNPKTKKFERFNSYDGVPNDGFSEASATTTVDGQLVFGTLNGLVTFDPLKIKYHPIQANMIFTNLQVNSRDVKVGEEQQILSENIDNTQQITLNHDQNIFSIDYAILDFRSGDRQHYLYRLKGHDTNWHDNKSQRRASYTNIPPGDYTFEVKSEKEGDYSNVPTKSLRITILPPFWKTWWAYTIYSMLLIVAFVIARRIFLTFLHLRQEIAVEQKMTSLKMAFFTNVSHELRTPLALILGPIEEILKKTELNEQVKDYASIVKKNATRMVHFVNQLLDLRKSQSGQSQLRLSNVEILGFIEKIASNFTEEAKAKEVRLEITCDSQISTLVDADKLETVIYNLLGNAIKFSSPKQRINITISTLTEVDHFLIAVNDQGAGVPESDLESIFQLYHESRNPATQYIKGTGIGLALARELVELHGGTIWATNLQPHGLSVQARIPLRKALVTDAVNKPNENLPLNEVEVAGSSMPILSSTEKEDSLKQSLLLVEDNDEMSAFLCSLLKDKYNIVTAPDGLKGLALTKKLQPDVVLSDIMMPNMDGIEMLDKLKNDPLTSHIPVILLSAKSALESQINGLKYGADYYISKPFNNELLITALESILQQRKRLIERLVDGQKVVDLSPQQVVVTSRDEQFLKKVIEIVEDKMTDPDFDIETVAKMVNMARTTFFMKFKSLTQLAPVEFVRDMRLKKAKYLLDGGAGNISEVSYAVGFGNAKYFSTCFKAAYGLSPSEYIKSIKTSG